SLSAGFFTMEPRAAPNPTLVRSAFEASASPDGRVARRVGGDPHPPPDQAVPARAASTREHRSGADPESIAPAAFHRVCCRASGSGLCRAAGFHVPRGEGIRRALGVGVGVGVPVSPPRGRAGGLPIFFSAATSPVHARL